MTLQEFRTMLNTLDIPVYHGMALKEDKRYISWTEKKRRYLYSDDAAIEIEYKIDVVLFTKIEYDKIVSQIEKMFDHNFIAFDSCDIKHYDDGFWSYSWEVEINFSGENENV